MAEVILITIPTEDMIHELADAAGDGDMEALEMLELMALRYVRIANSLKDQVT